MAQDKTYDDPTFYLTYNGLDTNSVNQDPFGNWLENSVVYSVQHIKKATLFSTLLQIGNSTGGYVKLLPDVSCLPALIGNDKRPIFLYQFIELIDEFTDYDKIKEEYPTLSYSQIGGAFSFLRKVAQLNAKDIDIDDLEDDDPELLDELRKALNDKEIAHVFPDPQ